MRSTAVSHPIDEDAARFYLRFGLEPSPIREQQLLLLLKDAGRLITSPVAQVAEAESDGTEPKDEEIGIGE